MKLPWVDKYRPHKLDDVVHQDDVIRFLKEVIKTGNMPHLLLYGPPGTGKTSTILAIAKELYGPTLMKERIIELNASDERGISTVRTKIKSFARAAIGKTDPNFPCPPFKIIILDEADTMTTEAQSALRKTIEDTSRITRFCFICNYINHIIDPIASRCTKFRFKDLPIDLMTSKLKIIAEKEDIKVTDKVLNALIGTVNGDMRRAIMQLQNLKYIIDDEKELTCKDLYNILGIIPEKEITTALEKCKDIKDIKRETTKIFNMGYQISSILDKINTYVVNNENIDDKNKAVMCMTLAQTEKDLTDGADEYLQLLKVFICLFDVYSKFATKTIIL